MSILIKDMEMPKEGFIEILIYDDGTAQQTGQSYRVNGNDCYMPYIGEMPIIYKAVSVPAHGRLIDADEFFKDICNSLNEMTAIGITVDGEWLWNKLNDSLNNTPTIIPANGSET